MEQEEVVHAHLRHRRDTLGVFETLMHMNLRDYVAMCATD